MFDSPLTRYAKRPAQFNNVAAYISLEAGVASAASTLSNKPCFMCQFCITLTFMNETLLLLFLGFGGFSVL